MAVTGESLGRLFVELGLADDQFLSGVKNALQQVGALRDGVVKAGKTAAEGMKPLTTAIVQVTDAERKAAEAVRAFSANESARAQALGLSVQQLRQMDSALKAVAAAEGKAMEAAAQAVNAGIKPLATAFAQVTEAEKRAVASMVAAEASEKARARALGITIGQLRELDRAHKAAAQAAQAQAAAEMKTAAAEKAAGDAALAEAAALKARTTVASDSARKGLAVAGSQTSTSAFGSAQSSGLAVVTPTSTADQVTQLAAIGIAVQQVTSALGNAVVASSQYSNAFSGLRSVANSFGQDADAAQAAAEKLAADGLLPAGQAAQGFKNALASGYSIEQATKLLEGLKEQAIFNRQAHYDLGGAIVATTEGIKNEQSILADATGTTTNLSQMWKQYAEQLGKAPGQLTAAEKRQAAYNGFLAETARSAGDLAKAQETLAGSIAKSETATKRAQVALGDALAPAYRLFLDVITAVAEAFSTLAKDFPGVTAGVATTVVALGTMATALSAARTAALLFQSSLGPVGMALAAISVAIGVAVTAYTAFSDAATESAEAQKKLQDALEDAGVPAALKRQQAAMDALAAAERELNDTQDGFSIASKKQVEVLKAKAEARRRELIEANRAVDTERELATERERLAGQTGATEEAEKKLAELREDNMDEPARLEEEMNRVLNSMAKATPDVLEGIRAEYLQKIAKAQAKAAKDGESATAKLQKQIDAARKSVLALQALAEEADRNASTARAEAGGQDPAIAVLEERLRAVATATDAALEDAQQISNEKARALAIEAATVAGEAAREAVVREWTTNGELAAEAEAEAYRKKQVEKRAKTVELLNEIDKAAAEDSAVGDLLADVPESARAGMTAAAKDLVDIRDEAARELAAGVWSSEEERAVAAEYFNGKIEDAEKALLERRKAALKELQAAYIETFSSVVSGLESVSADIATVFGEEIESIDAKLEASEEAQALQIQAEKEGIESLSDADQAALEQAIQNEEILTESQRMQQEARRGQAREAYLVAFNLNKAAAIGSIIVDTAQAVMNAATLPYPANIAAGIAMAALGAVQIGIVAAEEPAFERGGMITDEHRRRSPGSASGASVAANVHVGEGILTAGQGMSAIGGPAGLQLANMGIPLVPAYAARPSSVRGGASNSAPALGSAPPPFAPRSASRGGGGGSGEVPPIRFQSVIDGKVIDEVQVRAWDTGQSEVKRRVYRSAGVRAGLDR